MTNRYMPENLIDTGLSSSIMLLDVQIASWDAYILWGNHILLTELHKNQIHETEPVLLIVILCFAPKILHKKQTTPNTTCIQGSETQIIRHEQTLARVHDLIKEPLNLKHQRDITKWPQQENPKQIYSRRKEDSADVRWATEPTGYI
jgi:hypothetical protein